MADYNSIYDGRRPAGSGVAFGIMVLALAASFWLIGCDTFVGDLAGDVTANQRPVVEFANVPADGDTFVYAPVIHWRGRDADGFVEEFLYADIIDPTALADPKSYINYIPPEAWVTLEATSDTVYLLTETGKITEHIFYLKCRDDRGDESPVIYRRYFRSNQPPRVPQIKWGPANDSTFAEDVMLTDTLYVLDKITETWPGLTFNWKSTDPDDRDLYRIPLEYRFYLERSPHDTIWQWVSAGWSQSQEVQIFGLPTGHYVLTVWVRDDGFEPSVRPASITFDVYRPSFEKSVLLINSTFTSESGRSGLGNIIPGTQVAELYRDLSANYPDAEHFTFPADGSLLHKSYLGRFRLVIWYSENFRSTGAPFETPLVDYANIGGNVWVIGSFMRRNILTGNRLIGLARSSFGGPSPGVNVPTNGAEFTGAASSVRDLPELDIDTSKSAEVYSLFFQGNYGISPLLPGVDIIVTGSGAETCYYFKSYTDTASGDVVNENARVITSVGTIYYPPTPVDCLVRLNKKRVLAVSRVENITRGVRGEVQAVTNNVGPDLVTVVRVSYPYGEPWAVSDSIRVDYEYQPFSDFHLRPVGIRYERLSQLEGGLGYEVRYRVAVFTFPLYFMDNSDGAVTRMFNAMLNWFFLPFAH